MVKFTPGLETDDEAVTTTLPEVAPLGTVTRMLVGLQLVTVAVVPLNFTVPVVAPKLAPAIVTEVPIGPALGDKLVIEGVGTNVKLRPLLATPPTVATTLPVDAAAGTVATMLFAFQLVTAAATPLNVTVLCH